MGEREEKGRDTLTSVVGGVFFEIAIFEDMFLCTGHLCNQSLSHLLELLVEVEFLRCHQEKNFLRSICENGVPW